MLRLSPRTNKSKTTLLLSLRFGKFNKVLGSGLHILIPVVSDTLGFSVEAYGFCWA